MFLNIWVSLRYVVLFAFAGIIELYRVKIRHKNKVVNKCVNKLNSLVTEGVKGEKDIESLGLEGENNEEFKVMFLIENL